MKKVLICLGVSALLFSFLGAADANLIVNGDFETVDDTVGNVNGVRLDQLDLEPNATAWDVYGALPDGAGGNSWYDGNAGIEVQHNNALGFTDAHSGSHYAELDSHRPAGEGGTTNSSMSQDIQFSAAFEYYLSFYYRARTNDPQNPGDNGIDIYFDGLFLDHVEGVRADFPDWEQFTIGLGSVSPGIRTLTFSAVGTANTQGGLLDDIAVNAAPVPEPATMLLLGTGLVGLAGFRRKFKK